MLGLSAGALAFTASLLAEAKGFIGCYESILFHLHGVVQVISIGTGVLFSLNRVRDFDLTAQVARKRERDANGQSLSTLRKTLRRWGRLTRRLYFVQGLSFLIGVILFLWFVLLSHSELLYADSSLG